MGQKSHSLKSLIKKRLYLSLPIVTLLFSSSVFAQAKKYKLNDEHSYITWKVNHFGFSNVTGKFKAEGTITLDQDQPQNSKAEITVAMSTLDTGISTKFEDLLKGKQFFNVEAFPNSTFVSDKVEKTGDNLYKITGTLTMHGVSKPVEIKARLNKVGLHQYYGVNSAGFSAVSKIKRSDFGISAFTPGVSDDVNLDIEVEAREES